MHFKIPLSTVWCHWWLGTM